MTGNRCPACGQVQAFVGVQEQHPLSTQRPRVMVECTNIDCELYHDTGTAEGLTAWWEEEQKRKGEQDAT